MAKQLSPGHAAGEWWLGFEESLFHLIQGEAQAIGPAEPICQEEWQINNF